MDEIESARVACESCRWGDAWRTLSALPLDQLAIDDLDRLATAAYLIGRDEQAFDLWTNAFRRCLDGGRAHHAAAYGAKLARALGFKGDIPRCSGWIRRGAELLETSAIDCLEQGWLEYGLGFARLFEHGDVAGAHTQFTLAGKIGRRFADTELTTMARIGEGRMRIYLGEPSEGMAMLDAAFVTLEAREVGPLAAGDAYCTIIDACAELQDLVRLRAWTAGLTRWCDAQQELVLYRGHCFVHRAEVFRDLGEWAAGLEQARRACDRLAEPIMHGILGAAHGVEGDFHRLLGSFDAARSSYERAIELGSDPQPGPALLRLAEGATEPAHAMMQRVLAELEDPISRARPLAAAVQIALSAGDLDAAADAADELRAIAAQLGTALLHARAAYAQGAVLFARGDPRRAIAELRRGLDVFNTLEALADAAYARQLIADCCLALGDIEGAASERKAAQAALDRCTSSSEFEPPDGLSAREVEVLRLVARGKTNRVIAAELFISEKTVATHITHIFTKLGVNTRAAATGYAFDRKLV
jgi:DNA-binding NarL/FixJ family response regulator